jgi:O-antigen/teichoic acid export membrane protein
MSETLQLVRNIGSTLVTRAVTLVLALLSSVLLARVLGPEGRGIFALVMIVPSLAGTIGLLGLQQANAVYAGLEPRRRRALAWQSAAVAAGVGGALAAAGAIYFLAGTPGLEVLAPAPSTFVLLLLAMIPAQLVVQYWSVISQPDRQKARYAHSGISDLNGGSHVRANPQLRLSRRRRRQGGSHHRSPARSSSAQDGGLARRDF